MPDEKPNPTTSEPVASRPHMPGYGIQDAAAGMGLRPWSWAEERLVKARTYWIATTRLDGRPHLMPVWAIWKDQRLFFSTGLQSRKARNLAANPHCAFSVEAGNESVIVEGTVDRIVDPDVVRQFNVEYGAKYQWDTEGMDEPVYCLRPAVAFGFSSATGEFTASATRWTFSDD